MKPPTRLILALALGAALVAVPACRPSHGNPAPTPASASPSAASPSPSTSPPASPSPAASASPSPPAEGNPGTAPARFATVPPGRPLPTGAQCATWVKTKPYAENRPGNATANQTTGTPIDYMAQFGGGSDTAKVKQFGPRIDGDFTGTTGQILRWAACKWGIDEDIVFAQAALESRWDMNAKGDWTSDPKACPATHEIGKDGRAGECPDSIGILQVRNTSWRVTFPDVMTSTAQNADVAYASWRLCFEGAVTWLGQQAPGQPYQAGDAWGCVGVWFSGRWHQPASNEYITKVRGYLNERFWEQAQFKTV